jgi:flagellar export protein FliJ
LKSFRFKLERVMEWRRIQLRAAEDQLTQLQQHLVLLQRQEEMITTAYRENAQRLMSLQGVTGAELQSLAAFRDRTQRLHQAVLARKIKCEGLIADHRQRVMKARRNHRVLEKLKEQRLNTWTAENNRELEALADESFLAKWLREEAQDR